MGACGSGDDRSKKKIKTEKNDDIKVGNTEEANKNFSEKVQLIEVENKEIKEEEITTLKCIPNNYIPDQYHYRLIDLSTKNNYEDQIGGDIKLGDFINNLKLRQNGDFIINFGDNNNIGYDKINERFSDLLAEIYNKNIPEVIEMKYEYKGLDIPENINDIIESYIESNKIIGSAILDNQELFYIITYEKENGLIKPYYYKRSNNEELVKFNLFTAYCNAKGYLYISGGENEQNSDPDKTIAKYNDFFYIDLNKLDENKDKIIINELPNLIESRTWHSMIYIPYKYIFIVGGSNTKSVEIYNMDTNEINIDSELNEFRSECTLCLVNNMYLYAFCGFLIHQEYNITIERCNLLKEKRKWEYVSINEKDGFNFRPSFFGVSYFKNDEILLIGGNDNGDENHYDYVYKIGKNEEEKDEIDDFKCNLNEENSVFRDKLFIPIGDNKSINIPLPIGEDIRMYILNTNDGDISIEKYGGLI
jgi:hypothetical protein